MIRKKSIDDFDYEFEKMLDEKPPRMTCVSAANCCSDETHVLMLFVYVVIFLIHTLGVLLIDITGTIIGRLSPAFTKHIREYALRQEHHYEI